MLTTILYRSHLAEDVPVKSLPAMVEKASQLNAQHGVSGILLFNGIHFFQLLEGPLAGVLTVYERIIADRRHHNIVELMRDYAPARRFGHTGMMLFDLSKHDRASVLQAVLDKGTSRWQQTTDDRALQFLRTFVESREKENYYEIPPAEYWEFVPDAESATDSGPAESRTPAENSGQVQSAGLQTARDQAGSRSQPAVLFQPVVDPLARQVNTVDGICTLPVSPEGGTLARAAAELQRMQMVMAAWPGPGGGQAVLTLSLSSQTLMATSGVAGQIVDAIEAAGLLSSQVVIAIDEREVISDFSRFMTTLTQLKASGISLCIQHFGAGTGGLSLLTRLQPERLKIDATIIQDIHRSGPQQAVVQAIIRCCSALEMIVIAGGVCQAEEWMWLEAAGITRFQGTLFAGPAAAGEAVISWPEYRENPSSLFKSVTEL